MTVTLRGERNPLQPIKGAQMSLRFSEEDLAAYRQRQIEQTAKKLPSLPDADDVARMRGKKPRYRNEPVTVDGEKFASKKQYARWCQLKMLEQAGKVSNLRREVPFELAPSVTLDGKKKPAVRYFADAVYKEDGVEVVEDTKSPITRRDPVYRIKRHLMMSVLGIEIREV